MQVACPSKQLLNFKSLTKKKVLSKCKNNEIKLCLRNYKNITFKKIIWKYHIQDLHFNSLGLKQKKLII